MDSSSIRLADSEIAEMRLDQGRFGLVFSRAYIVRTMTGSREQTLWWQAGELTMTEAEALSPLPRGAVCCLGGDIDDNIYTYRDMIPLPLDSRGQMRCSLRLRDQDQPVIVVGKTLRLEMADTPKYIQHLRVD